MALVRRQEAGLVPVELTRFIPEEWPASDADIELAGEGQRSAFHAWIRWIHARAYFGTRYGVDDDLIPNHTTRATFRRVEDSLGKAAMSD